MQLYEVATYAPACGLPPTLIFRVASRPRSSAAEAAVEDFGPRTARRSEPPRARSRAPRFEEGPAKLPSESPRVHDTSATRRARAARRKGTRETPIATGVADSTARQRSRGRAGVCCVMRERERSLAPRSPEPAGRPIVGRLRLSALERPTRTPPRPCPRRSEPRSADRPSQASMIRGRAQSRGQRIWSRRGRGGRSARSGRRRSARWRGSSRWRARSR